MADYTIINGELYHHGTKEINAGKKQSKSTMDRIGDVVSTAEKVNKWTKTGIDVWNTVADINNSLSDAKLPKLDGGKSKKNEADTRAKKIREKHLREVTKEEVVANIKKYTTKELEQIKNTWDAEKNIRNYEKKNKTKTKAIKNLKKIYVNV